MKRFRPRLSQHFLHDRRVAERIAAAVGAPPGAPVLEIGPGKGALTEHLLDRGWRVTAIELDRSLVAGLLARWGERPDLTVVSANALEYRLAPVPPGAPPWYVAANLPYAITSPILFHLLDQTESAPIAAMVLMVQKEVADRLAASPGTKAYGALTVSVRLAADVERLFEVGPGSFQPPPRVRSAVLRLTPHDRWTLGAAGRARVRTVARRLFGQRRKQLQKVLRTVGPEPLEAAAAVRVAETAGIDPRRRPETLTLEEWIRLAAALELPPGTLDGGPVFHTPG